MKFNDALENYKQDPTAQNLAKQVDALLKEMTLKEKVGLLKGNLIRFFIRILRGFIFRRKMLYYTYLGSGNRRLGIPQIAFTDGGRGIVAGHNTCFPVSALRAAAFDPQLEAEIGEVFAIEARANGANMFGGVCINVVRNPRWGRSQESYGEDPFLAGIMSSELVKSVQKHGVIAVAKHFAMNSIENLRFDIDVRADRRTLVEVYLPQFKMCVDAGAWSVMSAYNKVNGTYCAENKELLSDILRDEWGFDGFVVSDWLWGVHDTKESLQAGCDVEMPGSKHHNYSRVKKLINAGELSAETIDRSAARVIRVLLWQQAACKDYDKSVIKSREHVELSERAALAGMVLLKNNGVLPIARDKKIAVVGPFADRVNVGDRGSSEVDSDDSVTPYQGMKKLYSDVSLCSNSDIEECRTAAKGAEVVLVCVGCDHLQEGEFLINRGRVDKKPEGDVGGDRQSLHLKPEEVDLIKAMKAEGKKVVVALYTGSVILTEDFEEHAHGIFLAFYAGERAGDAVAKLLSGQVNFSGKLPYTIANRADEYPEFKEIGERPYEIRYGYYHGYTLFDKLGKEPAYPFGFGLSYTTFQIGNLSVEKSDDELQVAVDVKNTGKCHGTEVVQIYVGSNGAAGAPTEMEEVDVHGPASRFDRPVKLLKGFRRVDLKAGESKKVEISIPLADLRFYDPLEEKWKLDPSYTVYAGNSSQDAMNNWVSVGVEGEEWAVAGPGR